jgi:hypothetical protein
LTYIAQADVLNQCRVDVSTLDHLFEQLDDDAVKMCVLEAALLAFGERCADG